MQDKFNDQHTERLMRAISMLQTPDECRRFFEDLCTIAEIKAMAQRLEVAQMLEKHVVYSEIVAATGASTATISRVNRALNYGADGYRLVLEQLEDGAAQ